MFSSRINRACCFPETETSPFKSILFLSTGRSEHRHESVGLHLQVRGLHRQGQLKLIKPNPT
jgi:hypothetical protein